MKYIFISLASVILFSCNNGPEENKTTDTDGTVTAVKTAPVAKGGLSTVSMLPAQFAAYQEVSIFPKVNGYVKEVSVDIGSRVNKNQLLMTLEDPELEQAAARAKAEYEKAKSDYDINKENYSRLLEAAQTEGAVSAMDLALDKAKVSSSLATMNAEQSNWQEQETLLNYLQVHAPFSGVITARNVHPGALVSNSVKEVPMLELKQEDHLRLQIDVPEDVASELKTGDYVMFTIPSLHNKPMHGKISRISDNVNPEYRSERIELDVMNDGTLSSGMYADVTIKTSPDPDLFHVPSAAVSSDLKGKYISIKDGKSEKRVSVSVFRQSADSTEIAGDLHTGDTVILNN